MLENGKVHSTKVLCFMDLSVGFDTNHGLMIAKLKAYRFSASALLYILS